MKPLTGRLRRHLSLLAGSILVLSACIVFAPALLHAPLQSWVQQQSACQLRIDTLQINPFTATLHAKHLRLSCGDDTPLLALAALHIDMAVWESLWQRAVVIADIQLDSPQLALHRAADGSLTLPRLTANPSPTDDSAPSALPLRFQHIALQNGSMAWHDAAQHTPFHETLQQLQFSLDDLNTDKGTSSHYALSGQFSNGGSLAVQGQLALQPFRLDSHTRLQQLPLSHWQNAAPSPWDIVIDSGLASLSSDWTLASSAQGLSFSSHNGRLQLTDLNLRADTQTSPWLKLSQLTIDGIGLDQQQHRIRLGPVDVKQAEGWITRLADGSVQQPSSRPAPMTANAEPSTTSTPWHLHIDQLALNDSTVHWSDNSRTPAVNVDITPLQMHLGPLDAQSPEPIVLDASASLPEHGQLRLNGKLLQSFQQATLNLALDALAIKPFQAYADDGLQLEWLDGQLSANGQLTLDSDRVSFTGDAHLAQLLTRDTLKHKDFLKWHDLQLQQIQFNSREPQLTIGKVLLDQPYLRFTIKKDGHTNIEALRKPNPTPSSSASTKPLSLSIGNIALQQGQCDFADYSMQLPFVADMNNLNGEIKGFSSVRDHAAELALSGKVYDLALVSIAGRYQFRSGDADIGLQFRHLPLPLITPYMAEFAGYKIEKGQLALDLQYRIQQGELNAQNKLQIDQLVLGEHVDSPHTNNLPLDLAVVLLKDSAGNISLDFPITGRLDKPEFSIRALLVEAFTSIIGRTLSAPFNSFGNWFADDPSSSLIAFAAGNASLSADSTAKLAQLGSALQQKPALRLDVKGVAFQAEDWPVLRFDAVLDILKKMKSGELRDQGQTIRHEYLSLSDSEYRRLLAKFYGEVFPQQLGHNTSGQPLILSQPTAEFYSVAQQQLEAIMQPEPQRLSDLAVARANSIAKYLIERQQLARDRLYILAPDILPSQSRGIVSTLSLGVQP